MNKFGVPALLVSGVAAALLGLSAPASAGVDHHLWVHQMHQKATVPQVDTTVKHTNVNRTKAMSNR